MPKRVSLLTKEEQKALEQANLVWQMSNSRGWEEVFKPFLEERLNQSFPDPAKFTKEEEFLYAAKLASVFKKVIAEVLMWVESQVEQAKFLAKKEKGEIKDKFEIGRR